MVYRLDSLPPNDVEETQTERFSRNLAKLGYLTKPPRQPVPGTQPQVPLADIPAPVPEKPPLDKQPLPPTAPRNMTSTTETTVEKGGVPGIEQSISNIREATDKEQAAVGAISKQKAKDIGATDEIRHKLFKDEAEVVKKEKVMLDLTNKKLQTITKLDEQYRNELKEFKFQDYWIDKSAGHKIFAVIASALGGYASAYTGGPNVVADSIDNTIERDLRLQKANYDKIGDKLKANNTVYGRIRNKIDDDKTAFTMAKNILRQSAVDQIATIEASSQIAIEPQLAEQAKAQIEAKREQDISELAKHRAQKQITTTKKTMPVSDKKLPVLPQEDRKRMRLNMDNGRAVDKMIEYVKSGKIDTGFFSTLKAKARTLAGQQSADRAEFDSIYLGMLFDKTIAASGAQFSDKELEKRIKELPAGTITPEAFLRVMTTYRDKTVRTIEQDIKDLGGHYYIAPEYHDYAGGGKAERAKQQENFKKK